MACAFPPRPRILNAAELLPTVYAIVNRYRHLHNEILREVAPKNATFSNVARPLADLQNQSQSELDIIHLLKFVSTDPVTQQASKQAIGAYKRAKSIWTRDPKLFQLLRAVRYRTENLDCESALWLEHEFLQYVLLGHGRLTEAEIAEFSEEGLYLSSNIEKLPAFGEGGIWLAEEELQGVHSQAINMWRHDTHEENEGKIYVPLNPTNMWAIIPEATNPETRRKVYMAAEKLSPENAGRFKLIVLQRDSRARRLGFKNHAEYCSAGTFSQHPDDAENLLAKMREAHMPGTRRLVAMLQSLRIQDLKDRGFYMQGDEIHFPAWDYDYYLERLHRKHGVSQLAISRYFTMNHTIRAILRIISQCFRLRFHQVPPQELNERDIWHEDVQIWGVWEDEPDNLFVGYLYLDLYQREKKVRGPEVVNLQEGWIRPDGMRQYPCTVMIGHFYKEPSGGLSVLSHKGLIHLFHGMGHALQNLLSKTKYARYHGRTCSAEFYETTSLLFEELAWSKDILREISCHFTSVYPGFLTQWREMHPGAPDPPQKILDEVLDALIEMKAVYSASEQSYHLEMTSFDMMVHKPQTRQELVNLDIRAKSSQIRAEIRGLGYPRYEDLGGYPTRYMHMLLGRYDASTYSYISAAVYAHDIYQTVFAKDPKDPHAWDRLRREILEYGGSYGDETKMFRNYLGRDFDVYALSKWLQSGLERIGQV